MHILKIHIYPTKADNTRFNPRGKLINTLEECVYNRTDKMLAKVGSGVRECLIRSFENYQRTLLSSIPVKDAF